MGVGWKSGLKTPLVNTVFDPRNSYNAAESVWFAPTFDSGFALACM